MAERINTCLNSTWGLVSITIAIILYPALLIWQGGDLTDSGFFALNYQFFFKNLELGETNSPFFLSDFTGALWFRIFPNSGIMGLETLWLIFFYLIVYFIFLLLKDFTKNKLVLLTGIFCGVAFAARLTFFVFNYDIASWLFLILTSFFLVKGLNADRLLYLYFAGVSLAFACLFRLPDIVFIGLLPIIIIYHHAWNGRGLTFTHFWPLIKQYSFFIAGMFSLFAIMAGIFRYLNIDDIFLRNLVIDSGHSGLYILKSYLDDIIDFLPYLLSVTSLFLSTSLIYEYAKAPQKYIFFILFVILLFIVAFITCRGFSYNSGIKYLVPSFCAIPLVMSLVKKDKFSSVTMVTCVAAITQVTGTNTGLFLKLLNGFMVLIPLSLLILAGEKQFIFEKVKINTKPVLVLGVSFILIFSLYTSIGWVYHVDSGLICRLRCACKIENSKMKGILTTKENAQHIKQLCYSINRNTDDKSTLFIYGHQPMFYYLTETFPPVMKFWLTNNYVQVDELFLSLRESIELTGKYPLIVDTKQNIMGENGQNRLGEFLEEYGYDCIEENRSFNIWKKCQKKNENWE